MEKSLNPDRPILNPEESLASNLTGHVRFLVKHGFIIAQAPFGYRNVPRSTDGSVSYEKRPEFREYSDLEVNKREASILQEAFEAYATGDYSIAQLRVLLNARHQVLFSRSNFHKIMTNRFYIGFMQIKGNQYKHKYGALIDKDLFDRVQEIIQKNSNKKSISRDYALKSLVTCVCGSTVIGSSTNKGGTRYFYYKCNELYGKHGAVYIPEKILEYQVIKDLKTFVGQLENLNLNHPMVLNVIDSFKSVLEKIEEDREVFTKAAIIFFNSIILDGKALKFQYIPLFEVLREDPEYLAYKINKNDTSYCEFLIRKLAHPNWTIIEPQKVQDNNYSALKKRIIELCVKPIDTDKLLSELKLSLHTLQQDLIDLEMDGVIEEMSPGIWIKR